MTTKSYITSIGCVTCGEPRAIAIRRDMKLVFDDNSIIFCDWHLCDKCKEKFTKDKVIVMYECSEIDPKKGPQLTGRYLFVCEEACINNADNKDQKKFIKTERVCFCDEEFYDNLLEAKEKVLNGKETKEDKSK